ncbi:hypothetical protein, secreted [gut metagenome]|uniref:DUF4843 domain-containing protein n=1 Tax=gut metagenome TaxID=749906 RepID=J9GCZ2_9ZZZZ
MKKIAKFIGWTVLAASMAACTDEDYPLYDTGQKDSVFFEYVDAKNNPATSIEYAFNYNPDDFYMVEIPVTLMGMPANRERRIELNPVQDKTTMVEGKHYIIESAVLPANAINSVVKVKLLREDVALQQQAFTLLLQIGENEDLRSVGQNQFQITYSDIRPTVRPEWWVDYAPFPEYTFENAQLFFKYFYELAPKLNPDTYKEMIERYGHYFVHAEKNGGPMAFYRTFMMRILMAMYKDHSTDLIWPKGEPKL